jgi:single-strand DNA-binding protein
VITLRVALDDRQRNKERPGLFLDVEAWGQLAERCAESLRKGALCGVAGRLDRDEWSAKDGNTRERLFVVAASVDFLSPRSVQSEAPAA